jgi:hypothetical protein
MSEPKWDEMSDAARRLIAAARAVHKREDDNGPSASEGILLEEMLAAAAALEAAIPVMLDVDKPKLPKHGKIFSYFQCPRCFWDGPLHVAKCGGCGYIPDWTGVEIPK